ncbi:hypothetical protein OAK98_03230 [Mariniblastus sp.]|nr:hypothetical protein [Mariniblastus sp.]
MPFVEQGRGVALHFQVFGNGLPVMAQLLSQASFSMGDARFEFMHPCQQSCAGRRAAWSDVKVLQPNRFPTDLIHMRRLNERMPIATQVCVALVVGQNEKNVGPRNFFAPTPSHCNDWSTDG